MDDIESHIASADFRHLYGYGDRSFLLIGFLVDGTETDTTYRVELHEEDVPRAPFGIAGAERLVTIPVAIRSGSPLPPETDDPIRANFNYGAELIREWLRELEIPERMPHIDKLTERNIQDAIHDARELALQFIQRLAAEARQADPPIDMTPVMEPLIAFERQGDALIDALIDFQRGR